MIELEALSEIYEHEVLSFSLNSDTLIVSGQFTATTKLDSENSFFIIKGYDQSIKVSSISPIYFDFHMNSSENSTPEYSLHSNWLPPNLLQKLGDKLNTIINDNFSNKFWSCFEYLENSSIRFLTDNENSSSDLIINLNDIFPLEDECRINEMLQDFQQFNEYSSLCSFNKSIVDCQICMMAKRGIECVTIDGCSHLICRECLLHYFCEQLFKGITKLSCPVCDEHFPVDQLKRLMSAELFSKWENLCSLHYIKSLDDHKMCPKCETIIPVVSEDEFGFCKPCRHTFCLNCSEVFHGPKCCQYKQKGYAPIPTPVDEKQQRKRFFLNRESDKFIDKYFVKCPKCGTAYQRENSGCNHLRCSRCDTEFCYLCLQALPYVDAAAHFLTDCVRNLSRTEKSNLKVRLAHKGGF